MVWLQAGRCIWHQRLTSIFYKLTVTLLVMGAVCGITPAALAFP